MFKVTYKLMRNGKRVGFEVMDDVGISYKFSDIKIKDLMNNGELFDITFNSRGFQFRDKQRTISNLPSKEYQDVSLLKKFKSNILLNEYTGEDLKNYIISSGIQSLQERDFVNTIIEYCRIKDNRVLSISGLRGTGKTTGVLQSIHRLNDINNTVFITIEPEAKITCLDLKKLILEKYNDKKYIFIDEITRVKDLVNNAAFLADRLTMGGKKVIISGTDSLALVKAKHASLYHRVINKNVTHISFAEAKRTANQTLKEYRQMGGLYRADSISTIDELRNYIDTAVIANIMNTLTKNKGITSLLNIQNISERKLRTIVFRILYAIIYLNVQKIKDTSVKNIINLFDHSNSSVHDVTSLNTLVCSRLEIDENINTTVQEVGTVLTALQELGLLIRVENLYNKLECNYYITNPSIANQILKSIVDILDTTNLPKKSNATVKSQQGLIFECIVMAHTKAVADKFGCNVYFYHDRNNAEVDLIVEKITGDALDDLYVYYEIKLTPDSDTAILKSRWINDSNLDSVVDGLIIGRGIIYGGESKRFTGFEANNLYPPKNITLQALENQNMNIELINAEDYLINTFNKLKILIDYYN